MRLQNRKCNVQIEMRENAFTKPKMHLQNRKCMIQNRQCIKNQENANYKCANAKAQTTNTKTVIRNRTCARKCETFIQGSGIASEHARNNSKMRAEMLLQAATIQALEATVYNAKSAKKVFEVGDKVEAVWWNDDVSYVWSSAKITNVSNTVVEMYQKGIVQHEESGLDVEILIYDIEWLEGEKQQTKNRNQWDVRLPSQTRSSKRLKRG